MRSGKQRLVSRKQRARHALGAVPACRSPLAACRLFGYTLLELLLVLAIIVIVASAVAPTVVARMSEYRLKQGAEAARSALSATRLHAIDVSSVFQFRFEPGGRRYLAVPTDGDALSATQAAAGGALGRSTVVSGQLPENLAFQIAQPATPTMTAATTGGTNAPGMIAAATDTAWSAAVAHVPNGADFTSAIWSSPIVFRPDGTAMDAAVNVVNQQGDGFRLTVRELTGEVFLTRLITGTL